MTCGTRRVWRVFRSGLRVRGAPAERVHKRAERQQHDSPIEVHIDAQGLPVERGIARGAINDQNRPHQQEQNSQRQANVNAHWLSYQKMIFSKTVPASTMSASEAGLAYHASGSSSGLGVSE
jgi:hypothetical protein